MKYLLLLLVSVVGVSLAQLQCEQSISDQCPAEDPPLPVYIADPADCSAYCECSGGIAWHFVCAPDTLFDTTSNQCEWANSVDCGDRPKP